jgi:hypothetical protein
MTQLQNNLITVYFRHIQPFRKTRKQKLSETKKIVIESDLNMKHVSSPIDICFILISETALFEN